MQEPLIKPESSANKRSAAMNRKNSGGSPRPKLFLFVSALCICAVVLYIYNITSSLSQTKEKLASLNDLLRESRLIVERKEKELLQRDQECAQRAKQMEQRQASDNDRFQEDLQRVNGRLTELQQQYESAQSQREELQRQKEEIDVKLQDMQKQQQTDVEALKQEQGEALQHLQDERDKLKEELEQVRQQLSAAVAAQQAAEAQVLRAGKAQAEGAATAVGDELPMKNKEAAGQDSGVKPGSQDNRLTEQPVLNKDIKKSSDLDVRKSTLAGKDGEQTPAKTRSETNAIGGKGSAQEQASLEKLAAVTDRVPGRYRSAPGADDKTTNVKQQTEAAGTARLKPSAVRDNPQEDTANGANNAQQPPAEAAEKQQNQIIPTAAEGTKQTEAPNKERSTGVASVEKQVADQQPVANQPGQQLLPPHAASDNLRLAGQGVQQGGDGQQQGGDGQQQGGDGQQQGGDGQQQGGDGQQQGGDGQQQGGDGQQQGGDGQQLGGEKLQLAARGGYPGAGTDGEADTNDADDDADDVAADDMLPGLKQPGQEFQLNAPKEA